MVALPDNMVISETFIVPDIYLYCSFDESMYPDIPANLRSNFSQMGETNAEQVALDYLEKYDCS